MASTGPMRRNKAVRGAERRSQFRLEYSDEDRPRIIIGQGGTCQVLNLSEAGVRFLRRAEQEFRKDQPVVGRIVFAAGEAEEIQGRVIRIGQTTITLHLTRKLSYLRYGRELIRLRRKAVLAG